MQMATGLPINGVGFGQNLRTKPQNLDKTLWRAIVHKHRYIQTYIDTRDLGASCRFVNYYSKTRGLVRGLSRAFYPTLERSRVRNYNIKFNQVMYLYPMISGIL